MDENNVAHDSLAESQKGISNSTVAVLIILALLVTTIGTWAVLNSISQENAESSSSGTNVAQVSLTIIPSAQLPDQNVEKTALNIQ